NRSRIKYLMSTKYQAAPEVAEIARQLINRYPSQFGHLANYTIDYIWRDKCRKLKTKVVLACVWIQGGYPAAKIAKAINTQDWADGKEHKYFVLETALDTWKDLTATQREAVIAHELCHMGETEDGDIFLIPHDVEEFTFIAQTY